MPIGFILALWPAFIAWLELSSLILWNRSSGFLVSFYLWFIVPTLCLAVIDVYCRGSPLRRKRSLATGFMLGLAVSVLIFFPWGDLDMFRCEMNFSCDYTWDERFFFRRSYSDVGVAIIILLTFLEVVACLAWVILLFKSRRSA